MISEEHIASVIGVKRISKLGIALAVVPRSLICFTLMMEVIRCSETSVLIRATWRHIPEDGFLCSYRRERLKSFMISHHSFT
jgi:hypothetical protein